MRIAFHFELPPKGQSLIPFEEAFFRAALKLEGEVHAKLWRGQLPWSPFEPRGDVRVLANRLVDKENLGWVTVHPAVLETKLEKADIFVLVADGLSRKQTAAVDSSLFAEEPTYLGAIEVNLANGVHWAVYRERLLLWSRIVGRELRLLHLTEGLEGDRDTGMLAYWLSTRLFTRVTWEDIGLQGTVFDPYGSFVYQQGVAELEEVLGDHLTGLASQLLLRLEDLDPRLRDELLAAFRGFSRAEFAAELSSVATACRKFLCKLAEALFPARQGLSNGRKVGAEQYRHSDQNEDERIDDHMGSSFLWRGPLGEPALTWVRRPLS